MSTCTNRLRLACVSTFTLALALSGCGGGDPSASIDPGPVPLDIPSTLGGGALEPRYAETDADTLDSMNGMAFGAITATYVRDEAEASVALSRPANNNLTSITRDDAGDVTVDFALEGQGQVQFTADQVADVETVSREFFYEFDYWEIYPDDPGTSDRTIDKTYFDVGTWIAWQRDQRDDLWTTLDGVFAYGVRTAPAGLPAGTASYQGSMQGALWNNDGTVPAYGTHRRAIWGALNMEADFDAASISGRVDNIWVRTPRADGGDWVEWPDSTTMEFSVGRMVDGRFTVGWTGSDTSADTPDTHSLRGFSGDLLGEFYGPSAEEVAGVLNGWRDATATTPAQIIVGVIGGEMQE